MATKKSTPPKQSRKQSRRRSRQVRIPGTEGPSFPDIDRAAEEYVEIRDERMALTEREVDARGRVINAMKEHKLHAYWSDDFIVELVDADARVKVRKDKEDKPGDEGAS